MAGWLASMTVDWNRTSDDDLMVGWAHYQMRWGIYWKDPVVIVWCYVTCINRVEFNVCKMSDGTLEFYWN